MSTQDKSGKNAGSGTNEPLPPNFEEKAKQRFAELKLELPFEQYLEGERGEFARRMALQQSPASKYVPTLGTMTPCGNGDFEDPAKGIDPAEWQGAYSTVNAGSGSGGNPDFTVMTAGILPGGLQMGTIGNQSSQAHQTWVAAGPEPHVTIQTAAPGSSGAVRIGNDRWGGGCELLSKTFVVTPAQSTIAFWYAAVLQDPPGHPQSAKPYFMVRVTDAAGNVIPGAFDFGSGTGNQLISDSANPFFQSILIPNFVVPGGAPLLVAYRDWSCAQIDLSSQIDPVTQIGKQVTIEFVTADCMYSGCFGYAYIDNFCGDCAGSPTGNLSLDDASSTHCGPGQVCFDYTLPTTKDPKGNQVTGSVTIKLELFQNGALTPLTTLTSPTLTTGTSYCFSITPANIPGINTALGGFDFAATATFAIGSTGLGQIKVGTPPYGITPGQNNDYQIACKKSCAEIAQDQAAYLSTRCAKKVNLLPRTRCDGEQGHSSPLPGTTPGTPGTPDKGDCNCDCVALQLPDVKPCISVAWGDSQCDCMETDDVEVLCVTVCNCYSNVTFSDLVIGHIQITDMAGNPVPTLPDGTPSVQVVPSGPICFGDIGPCEGRNKPSCVSRELVLYTRGAVGKDYKLSFEGVCFTVCQNFQAEECFVVKLCQD